MISLRDKEGFKIGVRNIYTGIASFARKGHQDVFIQLPCFVVRRFEDRGAAHGRLGGRDEGEIPTGNS